MAYTVPADPEWDLQTLIDILFGILVGKMQLACMDTDTYAKEASCILSNLRNRVMRLFCQIPSIDIALINLLKSCMAYIYI